MTDQTKLSSDKPDVAASSTNREDQADAPPSTETDVLIPIEPSNGLRRPTETTDDVKQQRDDVTQRDDENKEVGNEEQKKLEYLKKKRQSLKESVLIALRERGRKSAGPLVPLKTKFLDWLLPRKPREYRLLSFVIFLFFLIIITFIVVYSLHTDPNLHIYKSQLFTLDMKTLDIDIKNTQNEVVLRARLWRTRPSDLLPFNCSNSSSQGICLSWRGLQELTINQIELDDETQCVAINWRALTGDVIHKDCFEFGDTKWYGGSEDFTAVSDQVNLQRDWFITGKEYGKVIHPYWLTSKSVAVIASNNSPLMLSVESKEENERGKSSPFFCLYSARDIYAQIMEQVQRDEFVPVTRTREDLSYNICVGKTMKQTHEAVVKHFINVDRQPNKAGNLGNLINNPVWSTSTYLKSNYNQTQLLKFAKEIRESKLGHSLLILDDGWQDPLEKFTFDETKFNDSVEMVKSLHEMAFVLTATVKPYITLQSSLFHEALTHKYLTFNSGILALSGDKNSASNIDAIIDLSSPDSASWWKSKLHEFQTTNDIDGFYFTGGEADTLPLGVKGKLVSSFTQESCRFAADLGENFTVIESAYRCQGHPVVIRQLPTSSKRFTNELNKTNTLRKVIWRAIQLGIMGYPYFIPEDISDSDSLPSKELYIRWMQIVTFFPVMHFSIPPSLYDNETVQIARNMVELHRKVVVPEIRKILNESLTKLTPLVRPVWWSDPTLNGTTSTQFTIGDILVAPVLEENARTRDIVFPKGRWEDPVNGAVYYGPTSRLNYKVPLEGIPYFIRRDST